MKKLLLILLILIAFHSGYSQDITVKRAKFLFVKARLMSTAYWVQYPSGRSSEFLISPVQVRLGYQISPRVAVMIALSGRKLKENYIARGTDTLGNLVTEGQKSVRKFFDIPILAKYTFSNLDKKLQFYGLGGFALVFARTSSTFTDTNGSEITRNQTYSERTTNSFASLAIGTSYRFSKHWEIDLEFGVNSNITYLGTRRLPLGSSRGIGVSYAFR